MREICEVKRIISNKGRFCVAGRMVASDLVRDAHREWLTVHVWTLRAEASYLPAPFRGQEAHGAPPGYYLLSVWLRR